MMTKKQRKQKAQKKEELGESVEKRRNPGKINGKNVRKRAMILFQS